MKKSKEPVPDYSYVTPCKGCADKQKIIERLQGKPVTTMTTEEYFRQQDDLAGLPFGVTFCDTEVFPPQLYYKTKEEAFAVLNGKRKVRNVYQRRPAKGECDEAKLLWGTWNL